jgi:endo-1,4-beta-D-glucanase Y
MHSLKCDLLRRLAGVAAWATVAACGAPSTPVREVNAFDATGGSNGQSRPPAMVEAGVGEQKVPTVVSDGATPPRDAAVPPRPAIDAGPPVGLGRCQLPSGARFSDVEAAYAKWKTDILTTAGAGGFVRPRRPNSSGAVVNSTVSEGVAYAMLLAAYMNDQDTFDKSWKYEQLFLDSHGLMHWYIDPTGTMPLGTGAATDGDEDMAFALVIAAQKWGGRGTLNADYIDLAKKQIDLIRAFEVDHTRGDLLMPGDMFAGAQITNVSYFAPAFYRVFAQVTGKPEWLRVVDSSYLALNNSMNAASGNTTNGLVPAWSTPDGVPQAPPGTGLPTHHQLDSCRTPFRLAQDYCWFDEPRALVYLDKINSFHQTIGASNIVDGYNLSGTPHAQFAAVGSQSAAFVGPAGVGAMADAAKYRKLLDDAYTDVASLNLLAGSQYYNTAWTALSLLMLNGRFTPR